MTNKSFEENTLAILDSSGIRDSRDIHDDRLAFLEAVRFVSLYSKSATAPTWKMYDAVFNVFREGKSLEEIVASYQLLFDLEERYPRLSLVDRSDGTPELVVSKEGWLPLELSGSSTSPVGDEAPKSTNGLLVLDAHGYYMLLHDLAGAAIEVDSEITMQILKNMLLLQYLVHVLERDFIMRETIYKETLNWVFLRESLLCLILGSRKINVRYFVRDCMAIISGGFSCHMNDLGKAKSIEVANSCGVTLANAMLELEKRTVIAVQKLLSLGINYDIHKKLADTNGFTSRADGVRVSIIEMIVDQLAYHKESISPFLLAFSEAEWKLEITVQYFWKYCGGSTVQTRRSNSSSDDATFETILKYFSTVSSAKSIARKMSSEIARMLLVHGFQAYLSVRRNTKLSFAVKGVNKDDPLLQVSEGLICAFKNIDEKNEFIERSAFEDEALFTAATILALDFEI